MEFTLPHTMQLHGEYRTVYVVEYREELDTFGTIVRVPEIARKQTNREPTGAIYSIEYWYEQSSAANRELDSRFGQPPTQSRIASQVGIPIATYKRCLMAFKESGGQWPPR